MEQLKNNTINEKEVEEAIKKLKEPVFVDKLELSDGEVYVGKLNDQDKFQLMIRHINILENNIKLMAEFTSMNAICLQELCKKQKIDIDKIINN